MQKHLSFLAPFHCRAVLLSLFILAACRPLCAAPSDYVVAARPGEAPPAIVLPYDEATKTGFNWEQLSQLPWDQKESAAAGAPFRAASYLREAVARMTGQTLPVVSGRDLTRGLVLTTLALAPADVRRDPAVQEALRNTGGDTYNANEAFYIRTGKDRTLVVANTPDGLTHGVVELLESVGYEILGMGPNWIHTPDFCGKPLVLHLEKAGRPGFYIRTLQAMNGQGYGTGTLPVVHDAGDETVFDSYRRWRIGTHMAGQSMPNFPGHAMQAMHRTLVDKMRETGNTTGFLVPQTTLGLDAARPVAAADNKDDLWINTDADGAPKGKVFLSNGAAWKEQNLSEMSANVDLSVPLVRELFLDSVKLQAQRHFEKNPDDPLIVGADPEDGAGYANLAALLHDRTWYPDYLKKEGVAFGQPYVLHGFKGLQQPRELWDPNAPSDTVFGFDNWVLREFDKWIDSLPAGQRVTATGKDKKQQVRVSLYSYNYHDVPPNFNLDPRIRVMIASFPKNRGWGKWKNYRTQIDLAEAYQKMLPREPSGDYWINGVAYYHDYRTEGLVPTSKLARTIANAIQTEYRAGFRALSVETDFNFGKRGLEYYLYSKMLWNPGLTATQLDGLRDRWLQRSFGAGWRTMKTYYDFMAPENYTLNTPRSWATAIRLIDAADAEIDGAREPDAQRRLDDLKQFWYFYYLIETGQTKPDSRAMKEFVWKGQMSYMTAMHMVAARFFNTRFANDAAGPEFNTGPARYTPEETQAWWRKVLENWQVQPVASFADATLANGVSGRSVDLNDLVAVRQFAPATPGQAATDFPFLYNGSSPAVQASFLTTASKAGQEVGFTLYWPSGPSTYYRARDVYYGVGRWNPAKKEWDELVDKTMFSVASSPAAGPDGKEYQLAQGRYRATEPGTYRIEVLNGGDLARLTTLAYDLGSDTYSAVRGHTYTGNLSGHTQSPTYFYIPKGTSSLDLEVWDSFDAKQLQLHTGLPATGMKRTRTEDVGSRGTHVVKLQPGEDGSLAMLTGNGLAFPYLYSVPMLWAKSPGALLVPRAVARADGLTEMQR